MARDMQNYASTRLAELLDVRGFMKPYDVIRDIERLDDDFDGDSYCPYYSQQDEVIDELDREFGQQAEDMGGGTYTAADWRKAKTEYAYALAWVAFSHYFEEAKRELIEGIEEFVEDAERELDVEDVQIQINYRCLHGWAAHDRELSDGTMIFESRQLDGCNGMERQIGNAWVSCCITPAAYEVIVGNIGKVYTGTDAEEAEETFEEYVEQSKSGYGRAGAEQVTMLLNGEIRKEYNPPRDQTKGTAEEVCERCGSRKLSDRSCDCFDNGCE